MMHYLLSHQTLLLIHEILSTKLMFRALDFSGIRASPREAGPDQLHQHSADSLAKQ